MFDLLKFKDNTAIISDDGESISYGELSNRICQFSDKITAKDLTFCLCENTIPSLIGYVACINNDIPVVMLDGKKDYELVKNLIDAYQPRYLWLPSRRQNEFEGELLFSEGSYSLTEKIYEDSIKGCEINPSLALCLTTSGSTGSPKFVRLSKRNLKSNAESIAAYLNITDNERPITSLPMYYSYGLSVINSHLMMGATILLTDKSVMQKEFWSFLKEQKATSISGVPYTYEMLKRLRFFKMEIPSLRTMTQAGGKLNKNIAKEFIEFALATGKKFIIMYGQTEATARMSYLPWEDALDKYASIGIAIPGGNLTIVNKDGLEINAVETDGELVYAGDNVSLGYAECGKDLSLGDENHGVLKTGDIAYMDNDGFFYITGRMKRFVKVWGNRCNLDALEQLIKSITSSCACGGVDDHITVFVTEAGLDSNIKNILVEKTGFHPSAFTIKILDNIPVTSNGKVDYQKLQEML